MYNILNYIENNIFNTIILIINTIIILLFIIEYLKLKKIKKIYLDLINKLGNGNNIEDVLNNYMNKTIEVEKINNEIINYCKILDDNIKNTIYKVGLIRYNAFKDVGSDLSFSLALLNEKNNGVVLNSVYSRDNSNIYAKPIINGESEYRLSEEEKLAIKKANEINNRIN